MDIKISVVAEHILIYASEFLGQRRYTSFSGLFPLLSRSALPLARVEDLSQAIESENFTVHSTIQFAGWLQLPLVPTPSLKHEASNGCRIIFSLIFLSVLNYALNFINIINDNM